MKKWYFRPFTRPEIDILKFLFRLPPKKFFSGLTINWINQPETTKYKGLITIPTDLNPGFRMHSQLFSKFQNTFDQ